jgi:hypothetical protein
MPSFKPQVATAYSTGAQSRLLGCRSKDDTGTPKMTVTTGGQRPMFDGLHITATDHFSVRGSVPNNFEVAAFVAAANFCRCCTQASRATPSMPASAQVAAHHASNSLCSCCQVSSTCMAWARISSQGTTGAAGGCTPLNGLATCSVFARLLCVFFGATLRSPDYWPPWHTPTAALQACDGRTRSACHRRGLIDLYVKAA